MSNIRDIKIPPLNITANGNEYTLVFDLNTFAEVEEKYGDTVTFLDKVKKLSPKAIRFMLWASLTENHPEITEKEAGKLLGLSNVVEVVNSVTTMLSGIGEALPQIAEEIKNLIPSLPPKNQ